MTTIYQATDTWVYLYLGTLGTSVGWYLLLNWGTALYLSGSGTRRGGEVLAANLPRYYPRLLV